MQARYSEGYMIVGIDEVGRGCWAGPVCVAACLLSAERPIKGLADSKALSARRREVMAPVIVKNARSVGIGWASARFIDAHGIVAALKKAAADAMAQIDGSYDEVIIDGTINLLEGRDVTLLKKADTLIPAVSAASIVAKVARDAYMTQLDDRFAGYGFASHVGYGTAMHKAALDQLGPSSLHRRTFAPMANQPVAAKPGGYVTSGAIAETKAAKNLQADGYRIIDRNWKTRWCEVDIIAEKDGVVRFFEVKYRRNAGAGSGLEYITQAKLHRMKFAAELWLSRHPAISASELGAIEVEGADYRVTQRISTLL